MLSGVSSVESNDVWGLEFSLGLVSEELRTSMEDVEELTLSRLLRRRTRARMRQRLRAFVMRLRLDSLRLVSGSEE